MRRSVKEVISNIFYLIIALIVAGVFAYFVGLYVDYDKGLYHRKYPNTTDYDYWMDHSNRK